MLQICLLEKRNIKLLSELYCNKKLCHFPFHAILLFLSPMSERQENTIKVHETLKFKC